MILEMLKSDILALVEKHFSTNDNMLWCVKTSTFWNIFIREYPLKYKVGNQYIVDTKAMISVIREMDICSKHKINRKRVYRYKFQRKQVNVYQFNQEKMHL